MLLECKEILNLYLIFRITNNNKISKNLKKIFLLVKIV